MIQQTSKVKWKEGSHRPQALSRLCWGRSHGFELPTPMVNHSKSRLLRQHPHGRAHPHGLGVGAWHMEADGAWRDTWATSEHGHLTGGTAPMVSCPPL